MILKRVVKTYFILCTPTKGEAKKLKADVEVRIE